MPNSLVQAYRDQLASQGQVDPSTDDQLTLQLGQVAAAQNQSAFEMYPDFAQDYQRVRDAAAPSLPREFTNAVSRGARSAAATLMGGVAAITDSPSIRAKALELETPTPDESETIPTMEDIAPGQHGLSALFSKDALRYGLSKAGGAVPSLAEGAGMAIAGGAIGSALEPGAGTLAGGAEGAVEGFLERGPIRAAIQKILAKGSTDGAASVAENLVKNGTIDEATEGALADAVREGNKDVIDLITRQAKATAARRGENSLNALNAYLQGAGSIYNETPDQGSALGLGAIAAIPNTIIPHMIASKLFPDVGLPEAITKTKSYISRLAIKSTETAGVGGSAGAIQEAANIIAKNLHDGKEALDFDKNDWSRIREAGVGGAIGGALAGPVAALEGGAHAPEETMPAPDPTAGQMEEPPEGSATEVPPVPSAQTAPPTVDATAGTTEPGAPDQAAADPTATEDNVASVPLMVTRQMGSQLRDLGYSIADINKMKPADAWELIKSGTPKLRPTEAQATPPVEEPAPIPTEAQPPVAPQTEPAPEAPSLNVPAEPTLDPAADHPAAADSTTPIADATVESTPSDQGAAPPVSEPAPNEKNMPIWAREEMIRRGLDPKRQLNDYDVRNPSVIDAVNNDPTLSEEERARLLKTGSTRATAIAPVDISFKDFASTELTPTQAAAIEPVASPKDPIGDTPKEVAPEVAAAAAPTEAAPVAANPLPTQKEVPVEPFKFGKIDQGGSIDFRKDDRMAGLPTDKLVKTLYDTVEGIKSTDGNRSQTRGALVLQAPDGHIVKAGFIIPQKVNDITGATHVEEPALQSFSRNRKDGARTVKDIEEGGPHPALLKDVLNNGYKPIAYLKFAEKPGKIFQQFPSEEAFDKTYSASLNAGEVRSKGKFVSVEAKIDQIRQQLETAKGKDRDKLLAKYRVLADQRALLFDINQDSAAELTDHNGGYIEPNLPSFRTASLIEGSIQTDRFKQVMARLENLGMDVSLVAKEFFRNGATGATDATGWHMIISMEDVARGTMVNLVTLMHEATHSLIGRMTEEQRTRVTTAAENMLSELRRSGLDASQKTGVKFALHVDAEDLLAESLGQRLTAEGIPEAPSLAKAIVRWVKDVYYRAAMALQAAFGVEPSDKLALDWVENNLRRETGGDFDYSLVHLAQRYVPEVAQTLIDRFTADPRRRSTPGGVVDFVDPLTWKRSQPAADSSTLDGLGWNLKYRPGEDDQARSRMEAAAINREVEIMRQIYKDSGTTQPWEVWWKLHGYGDIPEARLAKIEAFTPGMSSTKVGDKMMTPNMEKESLLNTRYQIEDTRNRALEQAAKKQTLIDTRNSELVELSQKKAVMERNFQDAHMHDLTLKENFKGLIGKLVDGTQRGMDLTAMGGSLAEAIREAGEIGEHDAIPENFQNFLKKGQYEHVSFFSYLREVGKMDVDFSEMSPSEIVKEIRRNADDNPTLAALTEDRPLLAAVAALAHENADQVDLIALGRMHNSAEFLKTVAAIKEVQEANDAGLRALSKKYVEGVKASSRTERIRQKMLERRAEWRRAQDSISKAQGDIDALHDTVTRLQPHIDALQQVTGAHADWQPGNGVKYTAMVLENNDTWTPTERTMVANQDGTFQNADQIDHDRRSTREWLNQNPDKAGTASYERIKKQNDEMQFADHRQQYYAHWRGFMDRMIQPIIEKLKGAGGEASARAAQMMLRWQAVLKDNWKPLEENSRWWTKSITTAEKESGIKDHAEFHRRIYDPIMYILGSRKGLNEDQAIRLAVREARARIKGPVGKHFAEAIGEMVRRTKVVNDHFISIAEKAGVFVEDDRLKTGLRDTVNRGYLTVMRKVDSAALQTITRDMLAAGWKVEYTVDKSGPSERKSVVRATTFDGLKPSDLVDGQKVREALAPKFTPGIISRWLEPFMNKPGAPLFKNGDIPISQIDVGQAWAQSGGDVVNFMDGLARELNLKPRPDGQDPLPAFRLSILKQLDGLFMMETKLAWDAAQTRNMFDPKGPRPHVMMDARVNESIPPEHLVHQYFDPSNSRTLLGVLGFHAAFGRNGERMVQAIDEMQRRTQTAAQHYNDIAGHFYDKKAREVEAESRGLKWSDLENASRNQRDVSGVMGDLEHLFGYHNQSGPLGDISGALKALSFVTGQIVNNPKTGLFNTISLFNRPLIQRDLSLNTIGASADATFQFGRGVLGEMLRRMGLNIIHGADYAEEISNVERGKFSQLPIGVAMADIGKSGNEQHSWQEKWMIRPMNRIGDFQRWTAIPGIGGIMNFISQEAAVANGVANVRQFERMIKRGIDYYKAHPEKLNDPTHRFTAKDLGMNNVGGFGSEGVFDYYKRRALEYRVGNIEDISREAMQRQAKGQRLLTTEQALGVSMMAANELNMEASVNTRIGAVSTNPILKYGMPLLGWPIQQMNAVNQALKTVDGQRSIVAATKTLARIAAWSLPMGVAFSIAMDQYDEKLLGKKSNLAPVDKWAGVPIIGIPALLLGAGHLTAGQNMMAIFERQSRAGLYGLAGDFITGLVSPQIDPSSGQRAFSLDDRVLVFSQVQTMMQTISALINQHGETTYASVWAPLARALGGNGVLHSVDLINNALGLDNQEARMTQRTNAQSWLRAAGRETGQELQSGGGEISSPTPLTPWIREMQLASYANDRLDFQEAYQKAIDAARQMGQPDPAAKVLESWKSRNPLNVFHTKPNMYDMAKLYGVMDSEGQQAVRSAINLFQQYTGFIAPSEAQKELTRQVRQDNPSLKARQSAVLSY